MSVKEQIIDGLSDVDDVSILNEILRLVQQKPNNEPTYFFNEKEKKAVEEGISDLELGKFYTNDEAKKLVSKWLNEQSAGLKEQ